ncbi:ester cyclase [Pleurocapsales cyanobacterium LEGE 06147]|nr:ester cyclase [Pleurocapsales cyanobacterium LEGE 06147]
MSEANKALARRYYRELMSEGNLAFVDEFMAPEFEFTNPTHPEPYRGSEFKNLVSMLRSAFPDLHFTVEHMLAQGDTVVGHWTARGTHMGTPLETLKGDIPAKGKPFAIDGMSWLRIVDGKFVEARINEDTLGLLQQIGALPTASPTESVSTEENEALVGRYFNEILSEGKLNVIDEIIADNFVLRIPTLHEPFRGREGMKQFVRGLRSAFPDIKFTVERQIAEKDKVASRFTSVSTHQREFQGIPPTGKQIKDQGVDIFCMVDGKIVEVWVNENAFGLMQQLGAIP